MKIVAISDTHNLHSRLDIPECDVLIHSGDATNNGTEPEVRAFMEWFGAQPARRKLFVPGNHDVLFESEMAFAKSIAVEHGVDVLMGGECAEIGGYTFCGYQMVPAFGRWAFGLKDMEKRILGARMCIPDDVDVLITHAPPKGILDSNRRGTICGCEGLLIRAFELRPRFHIFGHIHESHGVAYGLHTTFANAASLGARSSHGVNDPIVLRIPG